MILYSPLFCVRRSGITSLDGLGAFRPDSGAEGLLLLVWWRQDGNHRFFRNDGLVVKKGLLGIRAHVHEHDFFVPMTVHGVQGLIIGEVKNATCNAIDVATEGKRAASFVVNLGTEATLRTRKGRGAIKLEALLAGEQAAHVNIRASDDVLLIVEFGEDDANLAAQFDFQGVSPKPGLRGGEGIHAKAEGVIPQMQSSDRGVMGDLFRDEQSLAGGAPMREAASIDLPQDGVVRFLAKPLLRQAREVEAHDVEEAGELVLCGADVLQQLAALHGLLRLLERGDGVQDVGRQVDVGDVRARLDRADDLARQAEDGELAVQRRDRRRQRLNAGIGVRDLRGETGERRGGRRERLARVDKLVVVGLERDGGGRRGGALGRGSGGGHAGKWQEETRGWVGKWYGAGGGLGGGGGV